MDDKELSGAEEEKEVEKALLKPLLSLEDLVRFSAFEGTGGDSLRNLLQRGHETGTEWPGLEHANIGPYIQKMLAAAVPLGKIKSLVFFGIQSLLSLLSEILRRSFGSFKLLAKNFTFCKFAITQLSRAIQLSVQFGKNMYEELVCYVSYIFGSHISDRYSLLFIH